MKMTKILIISLCSVALLSGCARNIESNNYTEASVGESSFSYQGSIASVRKVTVQASDKLEQNSTGIGLGAVGGGIAGNQFGGGTGNIAATVGGAIAGAVIGSLIEKQLKTQEAFEYVVRLTNGQMLTVVQGLDAQFLVGQSVFVLVSHDGRSRIIADNSGVKDVQQHIPTPKVDVVKVR